MTIRRSPCHAAYFLKIITKHYVMIGEIFLQPHIYLHSDKDSEWRAYLSGWFLTPTNLPQAGIRRKPIIFSSIFDHLFLVNCGSPLRNPQNRGQNSLAPRYVPRVLHVVLHHKFGQASRTHFYITYRKRTASVNHPAQFIRSHLTIQKMRDANLSSESSDSPGFSYQS